MPDGPLPMIFLHIPKTAGTTFLEILRREYQDGFHRVPEDRRLVDPIHYLRSLPPDQRRRITALTGHIPFGVHRELGISRYVTFLRDPVERVVSTYYFILATASHPRREEVRKLTLAEFARYPGMAIDNGQTRFLSGTSEIGGRAPSRPMDRTDLERAFSNLQSHVVVAGVVERFDQSVRLVGRRFGWRLPIEYEVENATAGRPTVDELEEEQLQAIRVANALDIELYEAAKQRLERQLDSCV